MSVLPDREQIDFVLTDEKRFSCKPDTNILSWDRKSYLTHVILPRLSHEDCTLVVLELTHMVVK